MSEMPPFGLATTCLLLPRYPHLTVPSIITYRSAPVLIPRLRYCRSCFCQGGRRLDDPSTAGPLATPQEYLEYLYQISPVTSHIAELASQPSGVIGTIYLPCLYTRPSTRLFRRLFYSFQRTRGLNPLSHLPAGVDRYPVHQKLRFPLPAWRDDAYETNHHGSGPSLLEKVPVGPSGPSSARRTGSLAPSSTVCVPA